MRDLFDNRLEFEILRHLPVSILVLEPAINQEGAIDDFCFRFINVLGEERFGRPVTSLMGEGIVQRFPFVKENGLFDRYLTVSKTRVATRFEQRFRAELSNCDRDSTYLISVSPYKNFLLVVLDDITSQKHFETHLREQVQRDTLTGVYNRYYFETRAKHLLAVANREGWQVGLIYMDLDDFKSVNDTLGHTAGDALLKAFATRLESLVRDEDIFFRVGGDEFGLFLANTTQDAALHTATRLELALKEPFMYQEHVLPIRASMGVCVQRASQTSVEWLLEQADARMYMNKRRAGESTRRRSDWEK